jgi:hypothetical protein
MRIHSEVEEHDGDEERRQSKGKMGEVLFVEHMT